MHFFFTWKSFVNFFLIFKLESDFFPHFLSKIRKLENCENLSILNFKCAKFQRNPRQKNSSLHFTSLTHSLTHFTSLHFTSHEQVREVQVGLGSGTASLSFFFFFCQLSCFLSFFFFLSFFHYFFLIFPFSLSIFRSFFSLSKVSKFVCSLTLSSRLAGGFFF